MTPQRVTHNFATCGACLAQIDLGTTAQQSFDAQKRHNAICPKRGEQMQQHAQLLKEFEEDKRRAAAAAALAKPARAKRAR